DIATKEKELENLSSDDVEHKKSLKEIEKLERELASTNLAKIIESCQEKVIYVDNPPTEIAGADEDELELNKEERIKSRKIVLEHLNKNCQEDSYKPPKLKELSSQITDDYFQYIEKKKELEEEMKKLKTSSSSTNSPFLKATASITKYSASSSKLSSFATEGYDITIAIGKTIRELEDKKARLKK